MRELSSSTACLRWKSGVKVVEGRWLTMVDFCRYPPKMIPGIDISCCTTATNDRDARLLLSSLGVPFHGKHIN